MKLKYIYHIISVLFLFVATIEAKQPASSNSVIFLRKNEPRENAFTLLVPKGWIIEGGAIRILNEKFGGAMNMTECKFDIAVKKDKSGSVMIRWLPEMFCIEPGNAWGNPEGAIFNNAIVRSKRNPQQFARDIIVPYAHPHARGIVITETKNLPSIASIFQSSSPKELQYFTNMTYYASMVSVEYTEGGTKYSERILSVIEDFGSGGGGLWKNRTTILVRTPKGELQKWEKILSVIQNSGEWNMKWLAGEIRGQMQRQKTVAMTQQDIQRIDREIADGRRRTQEAIQRDMYLTQTGQNDYKNPFTGKIERDTAAWKYRWVNSNGNVIFSDNVNYNPNADPSINIKGYKLTPGR